MPHTFEYQDRPKHKKKKDDILPPPLLLRRRYERNEEEAAGPRERAVKSFKPRSIPPAMPLPPAAHDTHRGSISIPFRWLEERERERKKKNREKRKRETVIM
jgi:hypothetical protein